jgi:predicted unusual protein kinase regulating ubiquinone biosynthesis (AarF/ABC1/UbiB family)
VGPVAAASLGQVYKARLQSTGELVAVKVRFSISSADVGCVSSFCTGSDQILQMQKMIRLYEGVNVC